MDDAKLSGENPPQSPPLAKKRERPVGFGSPRKSHNRDIGWIMRGAFTALVPKRDSRKRIRVSALEAICVKFVQPA